jgi:hypothetical protein
MEKKTDREMERKAVLGKGEDKATLQINLRV